MFEKIVRNASEKAFFALIKSKCLPILFHGTEACPINSAVIQSLEFTVSKMYKIFGAMSKDSYGEICKYFVIIRWKSQFTIVRKKFLNSRGVNLSPTL